MQPFPSQEDLSALSATIELSGLETEYMDFGVFNIKDNGDRIGSIGLSDDEFADDPRGDVHFTYLIMMPVGNGFKVIQKDVIVRSRRQFYKELNELNEQLIRSVPSRRKNPASSLGSIALAGLAGYLLGKK